MRDNLRNLGSSFVITVFSEYPEFRFKYYLQGGGNKGTRSLYFSSFVCIGKSSFFFTKTLYFLLILQSSIYRQQLSVPLSHSLQERDAQLLQINISSSFLIFFRSSILSTIVVLSPSLTLCEKETTIANKISCQPKGLFV